jgi:hypothetical protein
MWASHQQSKKHKEVFSTNKNFSQYFVECREIKGSKDEATN